MRLDPQAKEFIKIFRFTDDYSKPDRVLSEAKIGGIFMTRVIVKPGGVIGNKYHKETRRMFYVAIGLVRGKFEHVMTRERKEFILETQKQAFHVPEYVALALKNEGKDDAIVVFFSNKPLKSEDNFEYKLL